MDEEAIEKADAKPLQPYFERIAGIKTAKDLDTAIAQFHRDGVSMFFGVGGGPDAKNSSINIVNAGQGGLTLPNKDFYTKEGKKDQEIREKFIGYMTNMFKLLGDSPETAAANAATVMKVQMRLANASLSSVELRDPDKRYNKITLAEAQILTPHFSWAKYMKVRGIPTVKDLNIGQADFYKEIDKVLTETPLDDLKTYMRFMVVNSSASRLSKRFVDENFDFFSRYLSGTKEQQPRWKTCVSVVDRTLGEALGQEYVKVAFKPEAKKRMNQMIDNLVDAFRVRINNLEWMGAETKKQALIKLGTFKRKIGSPDVLRGYKGLNIDRTSYYNNGSKLLYF